MAAGAVGIIIGSVIAATSKHLAQVSSGTLCIEAIRVLNVIGLP